MDFPTPFGPTSASLSPRSITRSAAREHPGISVRFSDPCELHHHPSRTLGIGKAQLHELPLRGNLDDVDLLEHLDPALDLLRLGRLVAEPLDEALGALHLLLLSGGLCAQLGEVRSAHLQESAVVSRVVHELPAVDLGDPGDHAIEEIPIVGDQDHGVGIGFEVGLEPVPRLQVQVVGGLVEEQQVRLLQEELREGDAHLPAAAERLGFPIELRGLEAQAEKNLFRPGLDAEAPVSVPFVPALSVAGDDRPVLRTLGVELPHPVLQPFHLDAQSEDGGERR